MHCVPGRDVSHYFLCRGDLLLVTSTPLGADFVMVHVFSSWLSTSVHSSHGACDTRTRSRIPPIISYQSASPVVPLVVFLHYAGLRRASDSFRGCLARSWQVLGGKIQELLAVLLTLGCTPRAVNKNQAALVSLDTGCSENLL